MILSLVFNLVYLMESFSDKLCFAWQGDYYSLKKFFNDELMRDGFWERPGGDN